MRNETNGCHPRHDKTDIGGFSVTRNRSLKPYVMCMRPSKRLSGRRLDLKLGTYFVTLFRSLKAFQIMNGAPGVITQGV